MGWHCAAPLHGVRNTVRSHFRRQVGPFLPAVAHPETKKCKPPQTALLCEHWFSPERSLHAHQISSDQSAGTASRRCWWPSARLAAPPVQAWSPGPSACFVTASALRIDVTQKMMTVITLGSLGCADPPDCLRHYNPCTPLGDECFQIIETCQRNSASSRNPAQLVNAGNRSQRSTLHSRLLMFSSALVTGMILDCFKIVCKVFFA